MAKDNLMSAMDSRTDLYIFAGIIALLEGTISQGSSNTAQKIIGICKLEQQRCLKSYDKHLYAYTHGKAKP